SAIALIKREFRSANLLQAQDTGAPILGVKSLLKFAEHAFAHKKPPALGTPKKVPAPKLKATTWPTLKAPLSFSIGKGGVGKTTISAALAFHQRVSDKKGSVAICSTDPAPSLDDIFQTDVGDQPKGVLGDPRLLASELDSVAEFRRWSSGVREKLDEAMSAK